MAKPRPIKNPGQLRTAAVFCIPTRAKTDTGGKRTTFTEIMRKVNIQQADDDFVGDDTRPQPRNRRWAVMRTADAEAVRGAKIVRIDGVEYTVEGGPTRIADWPIAARRSSFLTLVEQK